MPLEVIPEQSAPEVDLIVRAAPYERIHCLLQGGNPDRPPQRRREAEHRRGQPGGNRGVDLGGVVEGEPILLGVLGRHGRAVPPELNDRIQPNHNSSGPRSTIPLRRPVPACLRARISLPGARCSARMRGPAESQHLQLGLDVAIETTVKEAGEEVPCSGATVGRANAGGSARRESKGRAGP